MKHKVKLFNNGSDISPSEKFRYHLFFVAFLCCALASFELLAFFISSEFHDNIINTRTWCDVVRETKKPKHSVRCFWAKEKLWTLWIFIKCMCLNGVLILTVQDVNENAGGVGLRWAAAPGRDHKHGTTQRDIWTTLSIKKASAETTFHQDLWEAPFIVHWTQQICHV